MALSKALEKRYKELGCVINYGSRVKKIITSDGSATGIKLEDGKEYTPSRVVSTVGGFSTLFKMLDGKFGDKTTKKRSHRRGNTNDF